MCLGVFLLGRNPVWDFLVFLDLGGYFLSILGKLLTIIFSNIFLHLFFLSFSSGTPMIQMLGHLMLSQRFLRLSCCCCIALVMSDSVWPQRRQPIRLPYPWDPPGKNTGVGCHFLLQCIKVKSESEVTQSCLTPSNPRDCSPPSSSVHGILQARVLEWGAIASPWDCPHFFLSCFLHVALLQLFLLFYLPAHLSVLLLLSFCYWFPLMLFTSVIVFIADCLFFKSSGSLVNISCIFSICASNLFMCASILFPRF